MDNLIDFLSSCYQQITIKDNFLLIVVAFVAFLIVLRLLFVCLRCVFVATKIVLDFIFFSLKRIFNNKFDYSDYSPINLKKEKHYLSFKAQLDSYLSNKNVKNLAIFGDYGAGKSSLLETYFSQKNKYSDSLIKISLPDFSYAVENKDDAKKNDNFSLNSKSNDHSEGQSNSESGNDSKDIKQTINSLSNQDNANQTHRLDLRSVEIEILRQILYSSIGKRVPIFLLSKFKVSKKSVMAVSSIIVSLIIIFLYINYGLTRTFEYSFSMMFEELFKFNFYIVCLCVDLLYIVYIIGLYISSRFKLSNVTLGLVNASLCDKSSAGVIDSYIDELTFLFEQSKCKYVIFEDLDRTDNKEVLTHLRNLNFILNNDIRCKDNFLSKKRKIVFIYVLRRSVFKNSNDIAKFFEATINVTPFISHINSWLLMRSIRDKLSKKINEPEKKYFIESNLQDDFLKKLAMYLNDVRVIKEIFNDYQNLVSLFTNSIPEVSLTKMIKELFSFAVFRCSYAKESDDLACNRGVVYCLLNREYSSISLYCSANDEKILSNINELSSFYEYYSLSQRNLPPIEYFEDKKLLQFLLINNYLSEKYRVFQSLIPDERLLNLHKNAKSDKPKNNINWNFIFSVLNYGADFEPDNKLYDLSIDVFLDYFPKSVFLCPKLLNKSLFTAIIDRFFITNDYKYRTYLEKCVEFIFEFYNHNDNSFVLNQNQVENGIEQSICIVNFVFDFCTYIENCVDIEEKDKTNYINLWLSIVSDYSYRLLNKDSGGKIYFGALMKDLCSLLYVLSYDKKIFSNIDVCKNKKELEFFKNSVRKLIKLFNKNNTFQNNVIQRLPLLNAQLFRSVAVLQEKFDSIIPTLSMKDPNSRNFILCLINDGHNLISQQNRITFCFKENKQNFFTISKYIYEAFSSKEHKDFVTTKDNILTTLFKYTDDQISRFDVAFYIYLFSSQYPTNLLSIYNLEFDCKRTTSLHDNENTLYFVLCNDLYKLIFDRSFKNNGNQPERKDILSELNDELSFKKKVISNQNLKSILKLVDCEHIEIADLRKVIKACSLNSDYVKKWNVILQFYCPFNKNLFVVASSFAILLLLKYSHLNQENKSTPKHRILPSLENVIDASVFLEDEVSSISNKNPNSDYSNETSINNYAKEAKYIYDKCWNVLAEYFFEYYDEIIKNSSKNKKLDLCILPNYKDQPYSFENTKNYILSIKVKNQ